MPPACRFCPVAGECRARMEAVTRNDFGTDPDLLTPEEIGELLGQVDEIKAWVKALEETALKKAYSDSIEIPGWKVVLSGGRRSIQDQEAALMALKAIGYSTDEVAAVKLKGIGELQRLLGKETFDTVLGSLAVKGKGSPSMVPESDKRQAITALSEAQKEFSE